MPALKRLGCWLLLLGVWPCLVAATEAGPQERPNILFLMADDQGPWALGAAGNREAFTPHLDRLAREGARFPNAFTPTPVCSPARASVLTSRFGSELGILDWIHPEKDPGVGLDRRVVTWPELLRRGGYATALFGKWHVGNLDDQHPTRRGYETFVGFRGGGTTPRDPELEKEGVNARREGFTVDLVTEEAIAWLRGRDVGRPFAVSVHFREPHAAYLPVREEDWARVKDLDPAVPSPDIPGLDTARVKRTMREYLASVAALDRNVGRLLAVLEELKVAGNTLVIFTSDHGYNVGHHGLLYKGNAQWMLKPEALPPGTANVPQGQRPNLFDTSVRVPLLVRWPGVLRPGTVETGVVTHLDWLPTLAAAAGVAIPEGTVLRGRNRLPVWRGAAGGESEEIYAEYSMRHGAKADLRMVRAGGWKLVRDFANPGRDELYHLVVDPEERRNRIADAGTEAVRVRSELEARLRARMREFNDPVGASGVHGAAPQTPLP